MVRVTAAEWRVVTAFLRDGGSNRDIAHRIGLAEDTVKSHFKSILAATSQPHRTALVVALWRGRVRIVPPAYHHDEQYEEPETDD